jgi:hypothetical protein
VVNDGEYTREAQGRLEGPQGLYISYVVPGGNDIEMSAYEHSTVHMEDVKLRTDDDGLLEAVIDDAVTVNRIGVTPETDTDTDDDADGNSDTDETDTETSDATESPDGPETPQSSSADTATGEATADGGEIEAGDDAADGDGDSDTTETDAETTEMVTPDGLDKPDPNAPDSQKRRIFKIKSKLRAAATGDRNDFLTAEDLEGDLGWDRDIIDATIERLRRESNAMFGTPDEGWQMSK